MVEFSFGMATLGLISPIYRPIGQILYINVYMWGFILFCSKDIDGEDFFGISMVL
ncbi:hypothetical protein CsatA_004257 [Cannabis sativa]